MKKIKKQKKKQRVIKLNLDNTFEEKVLTRQGGKIDDGGGTVIFTPRNVFIEKKKRGFFKKQRRLVIYAEGTRNALKFKEVEKLPDGKSKLEMDDLNPFWTQGEAAEFVHKETADSLKSHKPLTWSQFIIILIPTIICLGLLFKIGSHIGAI